MPPYPTFNFESFFEAVKTSVTIKESLVKLGLHPGGENYVQFHKYVKKYDIDTSHFETTKKKRSDEEFVSVIRQSTSYADAMRRFGLKPSGGTHRSIRKRVAELGLDTSHFNTVLKWNGYGARGRKKRPIEELLTTGAACCHVKQRLIDEGLLEYKCAVCEISIWNGNSLTLQLDHINGDHLDNRLINLRLLCPNCHSQTESFCGRNKRRG